MLGRLIPVRKSDINRKETEKSGPLCPKKDAHCPQTVQTLALAFGIPKTFATFQSRNRMPTPRNRPQHPKLNYLVYNNLAYPPASAGKDYRIQHPPLIRQLCPHPCLGNEVSQFLSCNTFCPHVCRILFAGAWGPNARSRVPPQHIPRQSGVFVECVS